MNNTNPMTDTNELIHRADVAHHLEEFFTKYSIAQWIVTGNSSLLSIKKEVCFDE